MKFILIDVKLEWKFFVWDNKFLSTASVCSGEHREITPGVWITHERYTIQIICRQVYTDVRVHERKGRTSVPNATIGIISEATSDHTRAFMDEFKIQLAA